MADIEHTVVIDGTVKFLFGAEDEKDLLRKCFPSLSESSIDALVSELQPPSLSHVDPVFGQIAYEQRLLLRGWLRYREPTERAYEGVGISKGKGGEPISMRLCVKYPL